MPAGHNRLIEAVRAVQSNVAVVLMNGSAVTMPWADQVPAIVEAWLGGQAGGGAIADVLTGKEILRESYRKHSPRDWRTRLPTRIFPLGTKKRTMAKEFSSATATSMPGR